MKNINFHSMKNTPVPEELKKSVIAVPERSGTKRKVYPGRMIRFAVAAAFLAVITAVSVPLFMNIANAPIPVIPAATEGAQAPSGHTEKPSQPSATEPADPTRPPSAEKATAKPTAVPTQPGTQNAVSSPELSDISYEPTQPLIEPEISTQAPTQPPAPTQAPTQPPKVAPTEELEKKSPDLAPVGYDGIIIEKVPKDDIPDDSLICCRIYSEDGEILGDGDPYSEQHHARWYEVDGVVTMYYVPDGIDLPHTGVYRYEFYDAAGNTLSSGDELLMPQV
nr:hypothetical protein [uncultured Ruminococcus sp.]